jgi:LmbE family N-acetylglucosaminyl deacetylase
VVSVVSGGRPALRRHDEVPASALAVGAHPDDVEFGAGGTLARWAAGGCTVHHLVLTDGSKGTWDAAADTAALVATRQAEQRAAAEALGATGEVRFLGRVDGDLEADAPTRLEVARAIRELRPAAVLGHDPWRRYRLHPDHRAAGFLACDAVVAAREPHVDIDGLPAWRPSALLLWEADEPDVAVDVTGYAAAKLAALLAHASQHESTMAMTAAGGDEEEVFRRRVLDRLATWGRQIGVAHAEAFKLFADL